MELIGKLTEKESLSGSVTSAQTLSGVITASVGYPTYTGDYAFFATDQTQIIPVEGFLMTKNITIEPVPQNYGKITWNGSVLTVS